MLGLMYLYGSRFCGEGVARDLREAARWLELAAAQGSVLARQLLRRYDPAGTAGSAGRLGSPIPGIADCGSPSLEGAA
jgi:TPR repeat protein